MAGPRRRVRKDRHRKGLGEQIEAPENNGVRVYPRGGADKKRKRSAEDEAEEDKSLTAKITGRILKAAREQQEEVEAEDAEAVLHARLGGAGAAAARLGAGALSAALRRVAPPDSDDDDEDGEDGDEDGGAMPILAVPGSNDEGGADRPGRRHDALDAELRARTLAAGPSGVYEAGDEDEEVSPEDEAALAAFMAPSSGAAEPAAQPSLGDLVLAKLREKQKERGLDVLPEQGEDPVPEGLDEKVVAVYRGVGQLLSRYTVGKVPKAFKIIPNLKNWEEVLWLTDPDGWSPHAVYEATSLFVSNLNARLAQRFLALVLLPRVRREIREAQKLHFALFQALKKATYKPGAFYKGLLLPLAASRTCSLREAFIFSAVLKRTSIPVLHSAAALLRMAEMEYCGTTSFFIRVLLDKKYALPYRVIDALVDHFVRFADDERTMPVVWHQALLCFVQRYKDQIRGEDKVALRKLCAAQSHYLVTPEVIRELDHGRDRGAPMPSAAGSAPFASGALFTLGTGFAKLLGGGGGGKGGQLFPPVSHIAVVGKNTAEDVRHLAPVMMLEDD